MTYEAREAIGCCRGSGRYKTYLDFITPLLAGKEVVSSGMIKEWSAAAEALRIAASGRTVALVSGGDAGIYGMAGLVLELAGHPLGDICPDNADHGSPLHKIELWSFRVCPPCRQQPQCSARRLCTILPSSPFPTF